MIMGGLILLAVLAGWRPVAASFKWSASADLSAWLTSALLGRFLIPALVVGGLSIVGVTLLGGKPGAFAGGYVVVLALAWTAQMIAGHAQVGAYGVEYVIFALGLGLLLNHAIRLPDWIGRWSGPSSTSSPAW